jgi:RND family efflux transporter MFP subunit
VVPQPTTSTVIVEATGSVSVRNRVQLVPEVSGRIIAVSPALRAGGEFAAGEQLLAVDPAEFQLVLDQANADLAVARSRLQLAEAEADAARANYALLRPGKPVPPLVAKVPQINQGRAEVAAAEARVAVAALELSRTIFSLPFDGRISSSTAEVGQVLKDGQPFGEAFSMSALQIDVPVTQDDLARLAPAIGRSAIVSANGVERTAIVERVSAELDERTRFAKVFLTFEGSADLAPGTFVEVSLTGPELTNTFVLPGSAEQMNGRFWVADEGQLRRVSPQILARTPEGLLVDAFDAGDGVVVGAVPGGREGLAVRTARPDA